MFIKIHVFYSGGREVVFSHSINIVIIISDFHLNKCSVQENFPSMTVILFSDIITFLQSDENFIFNYKRLPKY